MALWRCARCGASVQVDPADDPPVCGGTVRIGDSTELDVHASSVMTKQPGPPGDEEGG